MTRISSLVAFLAVGLLTSAHPGQTDLEKRIEAEERRTYLASLERRDLTHCAPKLASRGVVERSIARRKEALIKLRKRANIENNEKLHKRQTSQFAFKEVLAKDHRSKLNLASSWKNADWTLLGQNQTTVLHPETTEGPYYVSGEYIRKDVREGQAGLTVHLDLQVIDINTCQPIADSAVEIWGSNATGVYSGVSGFTMGPMANGAADQAAQTANLQNQALRGIQITNKDGSVQFDTLLPGYYTGRTSHIHIMTHRNQTVLANKTITGGTVNHVGQIFFDQSLIDEIHKVPPYSTNQNFKTFNKNDMIMAAGTEHGADNVVNYVLLGDKLEQGIFAWLNFGIDYKASWKPRAATECGEKGCAVKPFDIIAEISGFLSGKGSGGPSPMPKLPPGGIPGFEMPSGGFFGPFGPPGGGGPPKGPGGPPKGPGGPPGGPFGDFLGSLLGGSKGKDGSSSNPGLLSPEGLGGLLGSFFGGGKGKDGNPMGPPIGPPKGPPQESQAKPVKRDQEPAILAE